MPRRRKITDLCAERYGDPVIAQAVMDDAIKLGTTARIESGELVLPTETDAEHWHRRMTGQVMTDEESSAMKARLIAVEQLVSEHDALLEKGNAERIKVLEARIAELQKGGK